MNGKGSVAKQEARRATPVPSVRRYGSPEESRVLGAPIGPLMFFVKAKPVSSNATYRRGKGSGFFKTQESRDYSDAVRQAGQLAMAGLAPLEGSVEVELVFRFDSLRPDIDGPVKGTLDALQGVCYGNDRQVDRLVVVKRLDRENPGVRVRVSREPPF